MKRNIFLIMLCAFVLVTFAACEPEPEPEPEEPEKPPEPTAEELYQRIKGLMGQLLVPGMVAPPDDMIQETLGQVQSRRSQLALTENGRNAIQMISRDVDDAIREARREERWRKVKALCMVYAALQPGNERFASLMEQAEMMMNRPQITVTGFVELDGELYAFLELFDPGTGETEQYRRREGEEFHDVMRLVRVVGNQQAVEVEYLPARFVWEVPGPRERARSGT